MGYYPYNSRKVLYRKPLGAVKENEKTVIRALLHGDARVHSVWLRVSNDSDNRIHEIELTPREWFEGYRFYDTEITLGEGLYWYDFRYTSD